MKVKELIEELKKCNPEGECFICIKDDGWMSIKEIKNYWGDGILFIEYIKD